MNFEFIGWCKDEKSNTDKLWCVIKLQDYGKESSYVVIWCRRGSRLQHKIYDKTETIRRYSARGFAASTLGSLINAKMKRYKEVYSSQLDEIYPEFRRDLETTAIWATLGIRN